MNKYYYKKGSKSRQKKLIKILSLGIFMSGLFIASYIFFPIISWQIYFHDAFASNDITLPIPKANVADSSLIESFIAQTKNVISGTDYSNVTNWFNGLDTNSASSKGKPRFSYYNITIPNKR